MPSKDNSIIQVPFNWIKQQQQIEQPNSLPSILFVQHWKMTPFKQILAFTVYVLLYLSTTQSKMVDFLLSWCLVQIVIRIEWINLTRDCQSASSALWWVCGGSVCFEHFSCISLFHQILIAWWFIPIGYFDWFCFFCDYPCPLFAHSVQEHYFLID